MSNRTIAEIAQIVEEGLDLGTVTVLSTFFTLELLEVTRVDDYTISIPDATAEERYATGISVVFNNDQSTLQRVIEVTLVDTEVFVVFGAVLPDTITVVAYSINAEYIPLIDHENTLNQATVGRGNPAETLCHITEDQYSAIQNTLSALTQASEEAVLTANAVASLEGDVTTLTADVDNLQQAGNASEWSALLQYTANSLAIGSDDHLYTALQTNINHDPVASPTYWSRANVVTQGDIDPYLASDEEALAGTLTSKGITPHGLAAAIAAVIDDVGVSIDSFLYERLAGHISIGGFMMQWGTVSSVGSWTSQAKSFPMAFPTACLGMVLIPGESTAFESSWQYRSWVVDEEDYQILTVGCSGVWNWFAWGY